MRCEHCQILIYAAATWKSSGRFYCSEFCADTKASSLPSAHKDKIDRQYLERLARLLPFARQRADTLRRPKA
jgi:Prokaryotic metallothionein